MSSCGRRFPGGSNPMELLFGRYGTPSLCSAGHSVGFALRKCTMRIPKRGWQLTHFRLHSTVKASLMSVSKIQVGQLWKKDATGDIYLVTRLYSEALNTMAVLRKSGAEGEAQIRVRVERAAKGQTIPGFSPAQEEESY